MSAFNLIHLRVTDCPFYPALGIQQITAYGNTVHARDSSSAICAVVIELNSDDENSKKKVRKRVRENFKQLDHYALYETGLDNKENTDGPVVFSKYNLTKLAQASTSHFARLVRGVHFPSFLKDPTAYSPSQQRDQRTTFAMAACIYNEPGTLYTILSSLTTQDNGTDPKFDLNIEYLRAEDLRIADLYAIEIYGTYIPESDALAGSQRNICGLVFYGDPLPAGVDQIRERLGLTKPDKENVLKEAYDLNELPRVKMEPYAAYACSNRSTEPENRSQRLPTMRSCPISRVALCPTLRTSTHRDDRLRAKIHVLVHDVPGALCQSLELIGSVSN